MNFQLVTLQRGHQVFGREIARLIDLAEYLESKVLFLTSDCDEVQEQLAGLMLELSQAVAKVMVWKATNERLGQQRLKPFSTAEGKEVQP